LGVMNCKNFLDLYSDWADGLVVDDDDRRALEFHRNHCRSCGQKDKALRRGLLVLRSLDCQPADRRFSARLEARLQSSNPLAGARVPAWAGAAALMLGLLALAVIGLDLLPHTRARIAHASPDDVPAPVIHDGIPFVTFQDRHVTVMVYAAADPHIPPLRPRVAAFR